MGKRTAVSRESFAASGPGFSEVIQMVDLGPGQKSHGSTTHRAT